MCLSIVKMITPVGEETLGEYVSSLQVSGKNVEFTDIMGSTASVYGTIKHIDLINNIITISSPVDNQNG